MDDAADLPDSSRCAGCAARLAHDQRYCLECGARRGPLPARLAAVIVGIAPSAAVVDSVHDADAPEHEDEDEEAARRGWVPAPRATAVAILSMLAFGVVAGSLVKPGAVSLARTYIVAMPPAARTPAVAPAANSAPAPSGGGGSPASRPAPSSSPASAPQPAAAAAPVVPPATGGGGGAGGGAGGGGGGLLGLPPVKHVFLIVLSGQGYANTFSPASADRYLSRTLPRKGELINNYYAVAGSSLANGVALISGQGPTQQTAGNCPTFTLISPATTHAGQIMGDGCVYPAGAHTVADQLAAKHHTWRAYVQGIGNGPAGQPKACRFPKLNSTDSNQLPRPGDPYVTWRNPFVYFDSLILGPGCQKNDVNLNRLDSDLKKPGKAPSLAYIVPSPCDDGSDQPCSPGAKAGLPAADAFLKAILPKIWQSAAYKDGGLIAITFDQAPQTGLGADSSACCGNPAYPNLAPAPTAPPPATTTTPTTSTPTTSTPTTPGVTTTPTTPTTTITTTTPTTTTTSPATTTPTTPPPSAGTGQTTPTGGGGQVGLLLISSFVKPGSSDLVDYYNHFSLLASIEDLFGLKHLGYAGDPSLPRFDGATYNAHKP
jgi:phosphoesterase family protein